MKRERTSALNRVKWFFYDLKVKIFGGGKSKPPRPHNKKAGQSVFLFFFMLLPILQFLIFYVGVNVNSLKLAFQKYDGTKYVFAGVENFGAVLKAIFTEGGELVRPLKNSAIQFAVGLLIGMPLQVMVAYVIFKEVPLSEFYKVMLFLPNIISSLVFVICVRMIVQKGFPIIFNKPGMNLLSQLNSSSFYTVLIFGLWMNFAGGLIIYLSAMCGISKDVIEYGQLEDMSSFQEFWYVVLPSIFPTIVTYIVVAIAGFFTNYGHFYSFFGGEGRGEKPFDTLGYYFFVKVVGDNVTLYDYPFAAAGGILFTIVVAPITLLTKHLLEKYGPSED